MSNNLTQEGGDQRRSSQNLIEGVAKVAGNAIGGALGLLCDGTVGSIVAPVAAGYVNEMLGNVAKEVNRRMLAPRELLRIDSTLSVAIEQIDRRLKNGEVVRKDGFFNQNTSGRSNADEVAEHILSKCQRECEEKKIKYLGIFLSKIAFDPDIDTHLAHQLTKCAEDLTYRQFCLLNIFANKQLRSSLRSNNYREIRFFPLALRQVLYECHALSIRDYISSGEANLGVTDMSPGTMRTQGLGEDISNYLSLAEIPYEDLQSIIDILR